MLLPHVIAFTLPSAPEAAAALRQALGGDPVEVLSGLLVRLGAPTTLGELGADDTEFDTLAARAVDPPPPHPRIPTADEVHALFDAAL